MTGGISHGVERVGQRLLVPCASPEWRRCLDSQGGWGAGASAAGEVGALSKENPVAAGGRHKGRELPGTPTERKQGWRLEHPPCHCCPRNCWCCWVWRRANTRHLCLQFRDGGVACPVWSHCRHHNWSRHRLQEQKRDPQPTEGAQQASSA